MRKYCRYIDAEGVCIVENKLCDDCLNTSRLSYKSDFSTWKNITRIALMVDGKTYMTIELCGQCSPAAVKQYARDMVEILREKKVIK